jgi:hypothetical protein
MTFRLVTEYPITHYKCGLIAGDSLRLKQDIYILNSAGKRTGEVLTSGGIWTVLKGASEERRVLWSRQPDGKAHTWDDDASVFETFEKI